MSTLHCRDTTGNISYYPDEEARGSTAIFKQREEPDPNEDNDVL